MTKWLINCEDVMEEVEFDTLDEAIEYARDNTDIREADDEGCEI